MGRSPPRKNGSLEKSSQIFGLTMGFAHISYSTSSSFVHDAIKQRENKTMMATSEVIEAMVDGSPQAIETEVSSLLDSRPDDARINGNDAWIFCAAVACGVDYKTARQGFDALHYDPANGVGDGVHLKAIANMGYTCKPVNVGTTLTGIVKRCSPTKRYLLDGRNGVPSTVIHGEPVGFHWGRDKILNVWQVLPFDHTDAIQWHDTATFKQSRYRGADRPDISITLSACGRYRVSQHEGFAAMLEENNHGWRGGRPFETAEQAMESIAMQIV